MTDYRYHCSDCGKTLITSGAVSEDDRMCACTPPKLLMGTPYVVRIKPLSSEMQSILSISASSKLRTSLCAERGIANKSHSSHGSNFDSNQTLKSLVDNIVAVVPDGTDWERVRKLVITKYGYDITIKCMA